MAEFVLGLTKTAVEGTVSRVKAAIDEEAKLKFRVQNDLVFITGEFQMMQSFLNVANKERANNEVVRTWVRQVRDLAFDVEDCVELVVSLDVKSGWSWLWRVLPGCMAPPRPLDLAVAEIQRLKARVEDVSQRNTRYNLISDSGSSSNDNSKHALVTTTSFLASELMLPAITVDTCSSSAASFDILREVWGAAGKMRPDMGDLRRLITNDGKILEVISLWGGAGSAADLAKTNIIREAYNDLKICKEFKSRAWVKVMHPFNPDEFIRSLLTQFYTSSHPAKVLGAKFQREMRAAIAVEDNLMKAQLMKQVSDEQRYLVIVEALTTVSEWDSIRMYLPDSQNGSRILVTTQQLGLALSCTGNPYQVSEIRQFSRGQSLCAFFSKVSGRRSDMGELIWQLRCGGVVSVWGCYPGVSTLLDEVYKGLTHKSKVFEGVEFKRHCWVDVPTPFDLGVFSRRLFFNFHSYDLQAKEAVAVGALGDTGIIQSCYKILHEDDCLVVINGLNSTHDWDLIKAVFLAVPTRCCILITTEKENEARYCVDEDTRALNVDDLDTDTVLLHSIKAFEYYGIEAKEASGRGRFFAYRRKEAHDWRQKFKFVADPKGRCSKELRYLLQYPGVISLYGDTSALTLAREIYYEQMLIASEDDMHPMREADGSEIVDLKFTKYSWVNVPQPFNLIGFCLRLFMDFYSDDLEAKQTAAFTIMECRQDPVEGCLKFLRQDKCFTVIEGLQSRDDWDLIKDVLLSQPIKGCMVVITKEESVAKYCVHTEYGVTSHSLIRKDGKFNCIGSNEGPPRRLYAIRDECTNGLGLVGRQYELHALANQLEYSGVIFAWGFSGAGKSALVRTVYYHKMLRAHGGDYSEKNKMYSWVDVPRPFNLIELCRRLFLDFLSDDPQAKETAAIGIIEGRDPVQECREFLRHAKYLIVLDGLMSINDWDLIKGALLSEHTVGCIVVI